MTVLQGTLTRPKWGSCNPSRYTVRQKCIQKEHVNLFRRKTCWKVVMISMMVHQIREKHKIICTRYTKSYTFSIFGYWWMYR